MQKSIKKCYTIKLSSSLAFFFIPSFKLSKFVGGAKKFVKVSEVKSHVLFLEMFKY